MYVNCALVLIIVNTDPSHGQYYNIFIKNGESMSFNLLPLDQQDLVNGLPSFNNTLLLIETIKNLPNHSVTCLDKREQQQKHEDEDSLGIQINQNQKKTTQTPTLKRRKVGCTCTKTNCLKRYCECFSSGKMCSQECGCCNCFNNNENKSLIIQAKAEIQCKSSRKNYRGCVCKKSQCQKKYCECFNAGISCTESCKCKDCQNTFQHPPESEQSGDKIGLSIKQQKGKSDPCLSFLDVVSGLDV